MYMYPATSIDCQGLCNSANLPICSGEKKRRMKIQDDQVQMFLAISKRRCL